MTRRPFCTPLFFVAKGWKKHPAFPAGNRFTDCTQLIDPIQVCDPNSGLAFSPDKKCVGDERLGASSSWYYHIINNAANFPGVTCQSNVTSDEITDCSFYNSTDSCQRCPANFVPKYKENGLQDCAKLGHLQYPTGLTGTWIPCPIPNCTDICSRFNF
jgi:hypothetical protein